VVGVTILLLAVTRFGPSLYPLSIADGESMEEQLGQPLDGLELDYTYEGGGQVIASFARGRLNYRWLSGPFAGVEESGLNYQSRHVRDEIYLVNWHDKGNSNFVTLIIDLARKKVHSSALLYYGSENEVESFGEAAINQASRSE
jgi:hypothetical protein